MTGGRRAHGEVMVSTSRRMYKKLKMDTHENLGWGRIHLPEIELQTTAAWLIRRRRRRRGRARVAPRPTGYRAHGAGRAIQTVASVLLMVDPATSASSPRSARPMRSRPFTSTKRCPVASASPSGCTVGPGR